MLTDGREDERFGRIARETIAFADHRVREERRDEGDTAHRDEGERALASAGCGRKAPGRVEREEEEDGDAEEVRVVDAAQHCEEEGRCEGDARPPAPCREEAMKEEEGERHPVRREHVDVAELSETERPEGEERAGDRRSRERAPQLADEQRRAGPAEQEGSEQEDVVVEDRRGVKEIERQHEEHACQQVLREGEAVGERVEDVRLEERERVLAELVRAPGENPARQVVVGEDERRGCGGQLEKRPVGTRDERPGPGDGEEGERGEEGHRRRKMLRHRGAVL